MKKFSFYFLNHITKKNARRILLLAIFSASFFIHTSVFAAGLDLVTISTNPATPGPNQDITITIKSYAVNLNTAEIIWYIDKDPVERGVALKTFTLHTGNFGEQTVVNITIIPMNGEQVNKQIIIEPSEVDLLWEARTYTPPFYKGKALPTFKSMVKVTAIPRRNSSVTNSEPFYYKWTYNRTQVVGDALGMNSVLISAGWPDSSVPLAVDVHILNTNWKASENINIFGYKPIILFYEDAPLLGTLFNKSLAKIKKGEGNLFSLHAVPYFFSIDNYKKQELKYTWQINNQVTNPGYNPTNIQLTKSGKGEESFAIALLIQNPKRILQQGSIASTISLPSEE